MVLLIDASSSVSLHVIVTDWNVPLHDGVTNLYTKA